ncbi:MAG: hypothetical protein AAGE98_12405 [Actinomycetota bacterium]
MSPEAQAWIGGIGLFVLLVVSWLWFAFPDDDDEGGDRNTAAESSVREDVEAPEPAVNALETQRFDLVELEASAPTPLLDGSFVALRGAVDVDTFVGARINVAQCLVDGSPERTDCDIDGAGAARVDGDRFELRGVTVRRFLRVADGRTIDCAIGECVLAVVDPDADLLGWVRLTFGG